jgi:hypothetical protein
VRVFDGETALIGNPTELANFFALDPPTDPLFGVVAPVNGVGGVAFSGVGANGNSRNIVVGSARGTAVEVVEWEGNRTTPTRKVAVLDRTGRFIVQNVSLAVPIPVIEPLPVLLGYGATVGGFLD